MAKKHKPRSGSLAYYPKKRARSEKPRVKSFNRKNEEAKAMNFFAYKAGMTHILGTDQHQKSATFGQKVRFAVTLLECPPIKIVGYRAYIKSSKALKAISEEWTTELPKEISRKIAGLGKKKKDKKGKKESEEKTKAREEKKSSKKPGAELIAEKAEKISEVRLIGCLQPWLTGIGKKKPEIVEISIDGSVEKQLGYAKGMLGKELGAADVFTAKDFLDASAVTKGKGFQGVVKRAGVTIQGRKAKKRRIVGSIGPWHPADVMFTVARAGQLGYQHRTEQNKKLLKIGSDNVNSKSGFKKYGLIKNDYLMIEGSVPGPAKRCIALRKGLRKQPLEKHMIEEVDFVASKTL